MSSLTAHDLLFGKNNEKPLFNDRAQIKSWIQNRLIPLGILIVIERLDDTKIVFKCKLYRYLLAFKKVRQKRVLKKQKLLLQKKGLLEAIEAEQKLHQKKTSKCLCPFRIRANFLIRLNKWLIVIVNGEHNHPLKNCLTQSGALFNEASFDRDINVNLAKKRFVPDPDEPEMVDEQLCDIPRRTKRGSRKKLVGLQKSVEDDFSSLLSENLMDDLLEGLTSSATNGSVTNLQNFKIEPAGQDLPFFEPVKDELPEGGLLLDEFFKPEPRLKMEDINFGSQQYTNTRTDGVLDGLLLDTIPFDEQAFGVSLEESSLPVSTFFGDCPALYQPLFL